MNSRRPSDTDLHAYLDGELTGREREEYEALVDADAALKERLVGLEDANKRLRSALDPVAEEGIPVHLLATLMRDDTRPWRPGLTAIATSVVVFLVGATAGWSLNPGRGTSDLLASTAEWAQMAHRVYVSEIRHPVEVGADQQDHLVAWLSKRLGQPLKTPDLSGAGYRLVGGRLLPGDGAAAAQFMYEDDSKDRMTLYVAQNPDGRQTAFRMASKSGLQTFYWLDGPLGYAVTGTLGDKAMLDVAQLAYQQLTEPHVPDLLRGT